MVSWKNLKEELKEDWQEIKEIISGKETTKSRIKREAEEEERIKQAQIDMENKRSFVRMDTLYKIEAEIVIIKIGDYIVRSEANKIVLKDISGNGVAFLTDKYIDLSKEITAEISFKLLNTDIELVGDLVRLETVGDPFDYLYGVKVSSGNLTEDEMYKLLMKTGVYFKNVTPENSSIWKEYKNLWVE